MKKDIFKRILSVIMAVILCTGMLGGFSAFAAGEQVENYQLAFPRRGDINYSDKWGHGKLKHMNGWFSDEAKYNTVSTIGSYSGPACYCIEPGTPIENKYKLTSRDESYWDNFPSEYNHTITVPDIKIFIGRIMQYGYTGNVSINWRTQNEADADSFSLYYATQLLIWETVVGERDSDFNHITPVGCNAILDKIGAEHPMKSRIMSHYNNIVAGVKTHTTTPSFCSKTPSGGETKELKWDGSQYTATFTDTNNILQRFSFSADNGYICRVTGNTLTVSGTAAPKGTVTVTGVKNTAGRKGIIVWGDGIVKPGVGQQDLATYAATVRDPVTAFLRLRVSTGNIKIVKTSEGGRVDGITYRIKGNGIDKTVKTANGGSITADNLAPGEYTVTEETPEEYAEREAQHITVASGQTATVSFNNTLKKFKLTVIKADAEQGAAQGNASLAGAEYGIYKGNQLIDTYTTDADGSVIPTDGLLETAGCDENGKLTFKTDIPVGARLYVKEIATDEKYILSDEKYPVSFEYAGQGNAFVKIKVNGGETIKNNILYGSVKGLKIDRETESVIVGAVFGLFRSNETEFTDTNAILTAESDKDGVFTFGSVPYGSWIIKELKPANGYLPNDEIYTVTIDANGQIVEIAVANNRIPEIRTKAAVNGEKTAVADGEITVADTVYYNHLIPGRKYTVKGILMDRSTGAALLVNGKEITAEITFTPEKAKGEVIVRYTFDGKGIKCQTDIVVFEALYCDGEELAVHADIDDTDQTVTLTVPPAPYIPAPKTGDSSKLGFWIGLAAVALGGVISAGIIRIKSRKDDGE